MFLSSIAINAQENNNGVYFAYEKNDIFFNGGMHFIEIRNDSIFYNHFGINKPVVVNRRAKAGIINNNIAIVNKTMFEIFIDSIKVYKRINCVKKDTILEKNNCGLMNLWVDNYYKLSNRKKLNVCINSNLISHRVRKNKRLSFRKFKLLQKQNQLDITKRPDVFLSDLNRVENIDSP